jgi:hypothetical protein
MLDKNNLFYRRITTANYRDFLPAIEKSITRSARRNALAFERFFRGQA